MAIDDADMFANIELMNDMEINQLYNDILEVDPYCSIAVTQCSIYWGTVVSSVSNKNSACYSGYALYCAFYATSYTCSTKPSGSSSYVECDASKCNPPTYYRYEV